MLAPLNNLNAASAPTSEDDHRVGYSVGSIWIHVGVTSYICVSTAIGSVTWVNVLADLNSEGGELLGSALSRNQQQASADEALTELRAIRMHLEILTEQTFPISDLGK